MSTDDRSQGLGFRVALVKARDYDATSRLLSATKGRYSNTVSFNYDEASRVLSESLTAFGQTYTVGYNYDLDNRLTGLTYPDGSTVSHAFTDRDQLQQVDYNSNLVASFTYDDGMRETSRSFGNGLVTSRTYRNDNSPLKNGLFARTTHEVSS